MHPICIVMNIRSLSNPAQVLAKDKIEAQQGIKSNETADREANGQQLTGNNQDFYRPLVPEELEQALEKIRSHEGIVKHGLVVAAYVENGKNIVKIESPEGTVIKRILERDLFFYLFQEDKDSLQLVERAA